MKVKVIDAEEQLIKFAKRIIDTMPTTGHKFLSGVMLAGSTKKIEALLSGLTDSEGFVDTERLRESVKSGFSAAGSKVSFTIGSDAISWLMKPVVVNLTEEDFTKALTELEAKYQVS